MPDLLTRLASWRSFRAVVVGDYMLDELVFGDAERLTADAPVPVLQVRRTERVCGGSANVCRDLLALRAEVTAIGITGDDPEGVTLRAMLDEAGVNTTALVPDASRPTTVKRNLIGLAQHRHPQKMFRMDIESREPIPGAIRERLLDALDRVLPGADVVAIEDYAKGVCTPELCRAVIEKCRAAGVPVLVDPAKSADYTKYAGASAITPNRSEAEAATGMSTSEQADLAHNTALAQRLSELTSAEAIILTLDRHGALLLEHDRDPEMVPTIARQVYDVTGAGDMVLAALMGARANGLDWRQATRFANAAAGLEVEVFGVHPIPFEQVHRAVFDAERPQRRGKLRTIDELKEEIAARKAVGERIVFTNGCFDVLHSGHVSLIEEARALGDFLIVAINTNEVVRRLKGPTRPVNNERERATVLSGLAAVDAVVLFEQETPEQVLRELCPDILIKGAQYADDEIVGADIVRAHGGEVVRARMVEGKSTTAIVEKIQDGA